MNLCLADFRASKTRLCEVRKEIAKLSAKLLRSTSWGLGQEIAKSLTSLYLERDELEAQIRGAWK
jgi:hypothetical protein